MALPQRAWQLGDAARRQLLATAASRRSGGSGGSARAATADVDAAMTAAIQEESAASLGRAGRRLQERIAALAGAAGDDPARPMALAAAANALWEYIVQREAMGLTRHDGVTQVYAVPPELWRAMGSGRSA